MDKEEPTEPFDYDALDDETRQFVQQKADEIHGQLKRTAQGIINIGNNLKEVKQQLGHGHFLDWLQSEFGMTDRHARNFMYVASRFGSKSEIISDLPVTIIYELAAPSTAETVVSGVLTGAIPSTLQAVRSAKEALERAKDAQQQAYAEKESIEQQLQQERLQACIQMAELTAQIEHLQQQITDLSTPQIKEVSVVPAEITQQLDTLRTKVRTLTEQKDTLSRLVEQLGAEARARATSHPEQDEARRLRSAWQTTTHDFQSAVLKVLSQWPSPLDTLVFEATEWNRIEQVQRLCSRVIDECRHLREATMTSIVDAKERENSTLSEI